MKFNFIIRSFKFEDIDQILSIYNYYILNGLANFEENPLSKSLFEKMSHQILKNNLPFVVCENNKKIVGFAYLNKFRSKSGYRFTFEDSIYVLSEYVGNGVGNLLLTELISISSLQNNIKSIIAVIGGKNTAASITLHQKNGFKMIGTLKNIGFKKNQWLDAIYMQKEINEKN